jgi:hypothetical protein
VDAIRRRFRGHAAGAPQPRHRRAAAFGIGAAICVKAVQATETLGFEAVNGEAHLDDVGTQLGGREALNRLTDECVDTITQALPGIGIRTRFHTPHSTKHLFADATTGPNTDIRSRPMF